MRIAILNFSGNVGKTTLARDLFQYRLPDHDIISIESVNADGKETFVVRGSDGDALEAEVLINDNLILDIGSSNLEEFLERAGEDDGVLASIDCFVIPFTPDPKPINDSKKTVAALLTLGITPDKIRLICNQAEKGESYGASLAVLLDYGVRFDEDNRILRHDLYKNGKNLGEMLDDEDWPARIDECKDVDRKRARELAVRYVWQKKVRLLNDTYQDIFDRLMSDFSDFADD